MPACATTGRLSLSHQVTWVILSWFLLLSPANAEQPFDYFSNSYGVVGLKDYDTGVRIQPDNQFAGIQIKVGRSLRPLTAEHKKTLLNGWMPIVVIKTEENDVTYESLIWVTPLPTVTDWQKAFDWPVEGEKYLLWTVVKATNTGKNQAEAKASIATRDFTWTLAPGDSAKGVFRKPIGASGDFDAEDPDLWLRRTMEYWQGVRDKAPRIEVPDKKATDAFWAALAYQLISNDRGKYRPGEGFWDNYWIRDATYTEMQYEEVGMWDVVKKGFDYMFEWQQDDGRFDCAYDGQQSPQYDGNGQAIWSFWQYYKISADRQWMTENYPRMRKAVDWILSARKRSDASAPGLLPPAPADGENLWDGKHHIVGYDLWNLRGLLCAAEIARSLGKDDEADEMAKEAGLYRAAIDKAQEKTGLAYFPPSWEKDGTHWGNTETLWPVPIFEPNDPRVSALVKHLHQDFGGGFIEGVIQWGQDKTIIHGYMGAFTIMATMRQGNHEQAVEDFYGYLLHTSSAHAFAELIDYQTRKARSDTIPHTWGGCNYALMLRHMLVDERGDELHLLSAVPDWWLEKGQEIRVEKAPTHFGDFTFIVRGTDAGVDVEIVKPGRTPPKRIVLYLPKSRPLVKPIEGVAVVVREDQKELWTYSRVISSYRRGD